MLPSLLIAGAELVATCDIPETTGAQLPVPLASIRARPLVKPPGAPDSRDEAEEDVAIRVARNGRVDENIAVIGAGVAVVIRDAKERHPGRSRGRRTGGIGRRCVQHRATVCRHSRAHSRG